MGLPIGQQLPSRSVSVVSAGDQSPATINVTARDVASASTTGANGQTIITGTPTANSAARFVLSGQDAVFVQVSNTWTGTLEFEISQDGGTTWYVAGAHLRGVSYTVSTVTANCAGIINVAGCTNFGVRATAAWTGTAIIGITESVNNATSYATSNVVQIGGSPIATVATGTQAIGVSDGTNTANVAAAIGGNKSLYVTQTTVGSGALLTGQVSVTSTPVQLSSFALTQGVIIRTLSTASASVFFGTSSAVATTTGTEIPPGAPVNIPVNNANLIWLVSAAPQTVTIFGV